MITRLLNEPYVGPYNEKTLDLVIKKSHLESDPYQMYQILYDVYLNDYLILKEHKHLMASHQEVIKYIEDNIEELEKEFVLSIYYSTPDADNEIKSHEFAKLSLEQQITHLGLTKYLSDRNIIELFEINARVYKEYLKRLHD